MLFSLGTISLFGRPKFSLATAVLLTSFVASLIAVWIFSASWVFSRSITKLDFLPFKTALSPDEKWLFVSGVDGEIDAVDVRGQVSRVGVLAGRRVRKISFAADGNTVVFFAQKVFPPRGSPPWVGSVLLSRRTANGWSSPKPVIQDETGLSNAAVYHERNQIFAVYSSGSPGRAWLLNDGTEVAPPDWMPPCVENFWSFPFTGSVVLLTTDRVLQGFDARSGARLTTWTTQVSHDSGSEHWLYPRDVVVGPNSELLVLTHDRIYIVSSEGKIVSCLETAENGDFYDCASIDFPVGRRVLLCVASGKQAFIRDIMGGSVLSTLGEASDLKIPDDGIVLAGFFNNGDRIWIVRCNGETSFWVRRFPEWWWGHFCRIEVWAAILLAVSMLLSIWRDFQYFRCACAGPSVKGESR